MDNLLPPYYLEKFCMIQMIASFAYLFCKQMESKNVIQILKEMTEGRELIPNDNLPKESRMSFLGQFISGYMFVRFFEYLDIYLFKLFCFVLNRKSFLFDFIPYDRLLRLFCFVIVALLGCYVWNKELVFESHGYQLFMTIDRIFLSIVLGLLMYYHGYRFGREIKESFIFLFLWSSICGNVLIPCLSLFFEVRA